LNPIVRLGYCAVKLDGKGAAFVKSLPFAKYVSRPIIEAMRLLDAERAPSGRPDAVVLKIVRGARPRLKPSALKPAFLSGADLKKAGLAPGPEFAKILEAAARAQWRGKITSRGGALKWLGRHL